MYCGSQNFESDLDRGFKKEIEKFVRLFKYQNLKFFK